MPVFRCQNTPTSKRLTPKAIPKSIFTTLKKNCKNEFFPGERSKLPSLKEKNYTHF